MLRPRRAWLRRRRTKRPRPTQRRPTPMRWRLPMPPPRRSLRPLWPWSRPRRSRR
ncbi:2-oxoglutarate dehydrogenase E2, partial [Burkholderia thailandensis]